MEGAVADLAMGSSIGVPCFMEGLCLRETDNCGSSIESTKSTAQFWMLVSGLRTTQLAKCRSSNCVIGTSAPLMLVR